ncbi:MAG: hypothetical protein ABSH30_15355 [Acidimicrobiales bacterium]|jgi:hypothetical protein
MDPKPAIEGAGAIFALLVTALVVRDYYLRRKPRIRTDPPSVLPALLFCYAMPLFLLSRAYAVIGANPLYLPDVLAMICAGIALSRARWRHLEVFAVTCALIAVLMAHAVLVGREHHYPDAIKGLVLVVYPVLCVPIAAWASQRNDLERLLSYFPRVILPLIPLGLIITHGHHLIPSAYGLELGIAGAFAVVPRMPNRKLLAVTFLVGSLLLIAFSAKRGVTLTLLLSVAAAWIATRRLHNLSKRVMVALAAGVLIALMGTAVVAGIITVPTSVPILGRLAERASSNTTSASNNVTLRELMWNYALTTTLNNDPLLGVGAYHPIQVTLGNNNIAKHLSSGVHNSFIGYTFYAGYPEGLLVSGVFAWGLLRLWKVRRRSIYAPAMFGAIVSVIATALTNVSFEVTYMGGPSWLALGVAFGLSAKLMDVPDPELPVAAGRARRPLLAAGAGPSSEQAGLTRGDTASPA